MSTTEHWDGRYLEIGSTKVSWYEPEPTTSLDAIAGIYPELAEQSVIDVGGGTSELADSLWEAGCRDLTVVDLSAAALAEAAVRSQALGAEITYLQADLRDWLPTRTYQIWHDRAVFHFLTEETERAHYRSALLAGLAIGGHIVLAVFAEDGPTSCSALPVRRHSIAGLSEWLGAEFRVLSGFRKEHTTPSGSSQSFNWVTAVRIS